MYRSTKGASKARRDQINAEIRNLKDLLPISDVDKARLSYLHIMSLACMYTRKSVFFSQEGVTPESPEESAGCLSFTELEDLMQGTPGFLLLLTGEGKLLYLSDSVSDHLGHSMVDLVAQGDSVYDIIDAADHFIMRSSLAPPTTPDADKLFRCRFNASKSVRRQSAGNKLVLIRARCLSASAAPPTSYWTSNPVWVCFCTPLDQQPPQPGAGQEQQPGSLFLAGFHSQHRRDLRLQEAQSSVREYLGLEVEELRSRSWYSLLHPQDLAHASAQHYSLLKEGGEGRAEMVVRVEAADHSWVWVYMVLQLETGDNPISSNNFIISESEAWSVRQQLSSEQTQLSLVLSSTGPQQEPETLSSPDQVFTPGSSGLSAQSFDFSVAGCSSEEQTAGTSVATGASGEGPAPRSSISSLEEETFFQPSTSSEPLGSPSTASTSSPIPVTVATVSDLDFLTQNILLPPSFQLEPPLPALPLPLPPVPASQAQQTKEFVCTPPYTPQLGTGSSFPFGEPLFSFDPTGTTTPPPSQISTTVTTTTAASDSQAASSDPTNSPPPTTTTSLSSVQPLTLPIPTTELIFPVEPCGGSLYEKLPPTPDSPGDGDCTIMTLPEVRGPLYVEVPLGPLHYPPEGLLTPEASPGKHNCLSFFSPEQQLEEKTEISLLAQHISFLAEGFYPNPLYSKLSPSSAPVSPSLPSSLEAMDLDSVVPLMGDVYPIKSWRGLDLPILPDDDSLYEDSILESLLQDLASTPPLSPNTFLSCSSSSSPTPPSPSSSVCWHPALHVHGVSTGGAAHLCSVQSAHCNHVAICGATEQPAIDASDELVQDSEAESADEVPMEVEAPPSPSPLLSGGVPPSPLTLICSPCSSPASGPVSPAQSGLPCVQSLFEELAALEPTFGPDLGQQPELYQLQCHPVPQCFRKDGSGSDPPF
ncbi:neuronal PAS domain-containing protein 4A [Denticeps clupeoides]|uniref:Uncharacterized protein n=1 Tax=Denticeps clupeoides TaxID=299321 RepID=A0AAY4DA44_9TELE|nr:neuronal PAS domain-containing protein 4A-like [Denticeps clupeoides]